MNEVRELIQRFVENRGQLPPEELALLVAGLRLSPELAIELKDQLYFDELLAQKFDLTRCHFVLQIAQRLQDQSAGFTQVQTADLIENDGATSRDRIVPAMVPDHGHVALRMRENNSRPVEPFAKRSRWPRRTLALIVLSVVAAVGLWLYDNHSCVGLIETTMGDVKLIRQHRNQALSKSESIRVQDRIATSANASAVVRFQDGTSVKIEADSEVAFHSPNTTGRGKRVFVAHGQISADVVPQPAGKPMSFESPNAQAEVLGTSLKFLVESQQTHVTVIEGQVRVHRISDDQSIVVSKGEFAVVAAESLKLAPVGWPSDRTGLIFLFETNEQPNLVRSNSTGMNRSFSLRPRGGAHLNHDYAMVLTNGAFLAEDVDGEILTACRQAGQLSIEATIRPTLAKQEGPARIVTFSTTVLERDFTLGQLGDELIVRIRTPQTGPNGVAGVVGVNSDLPVCKLVAGEVSHVIVSYKPGQLVCYLNGKLVFEGEQIQGDFQGWSAQHLLFGDEYAGERNWAGSLEGVAIYNRFIELDEAERNALQYEHLRMSRPVVPQVSVVAELVEKSSIPTVTQIQPHRSALVVCKYRVKEVLEGSVDQPSLVVAQWALLDGQHQPIVKTPVGTEVALLLEPFDSNPQAQRYLYSDDLSLEEGIERFLEVLR